MGRPETMFFAIALGFGVLYSLATPPFQAADEIHHYYRAYQLSEGHAVGERSGAQSGGPLPAGVPALARLWQDIPFHPERKASSEKFSRSLALPLWAADRQFYHFPNTVRLSPVIYLPQALGIALGRLFWPNPLALMYWGRLIALLISTGLTTLAIRIAPIRKWTLALVALTPMAVFQRASLSADGPLNALAALFVAAFLRAAFGRESERIGPRETFALALLAILIAQAKLVYYPMVFLVLLIPPSRFGGRRGHTLVCLAIIGVATLACSGWALATMGLDIPLRPEVRYGDQARHVLARPDRFAYLVFVDLITNSHLYIQQLVGGLGWKDCDAPGIVLASFPTVLVVASLIECRAAPIRRGRIGIAAILAATVVALYLAFYITWTPVGLGAIEGIAGRYLIPIVPLGMLLLPRIAAFPTADAGPGRWVVPFATIALWATLQAIIFRYYSI